MLQAQYDAFEEHLLRDGHERKGLHRLRVCVWRFDRFLWYDQGERCGLHSRDNICRRGIPADQKKIERIHKETIMRVFTGNSAAQLWEKSPLWLLVH
jgi:hypothetical protein